MRNALMGSTNSRTKKQAKLAPTAECYGLDALETVKTSTGETTQDDELPEDLWPNSQRHGDETSAAVHWKP